MVVLEEEDLVAVAAVLEDLVAVPEVEAVPAEDGNKQKTPILKFIFGSGKSLKYNDLLNNL